jgi:hypothetical protein
MYTSYLDRKLRSEVSRNRKSVPHGAGRSARSKQVFSHGVNQLRYDAAPEFAIVKFTACCFCGKLGLRVLNFTRGAMR